MWKWIVSLSAIVGMAIFLCGWGQSIAYYLNEVFPSVSPLHALTAMTFTGYFLYLVSAALLFIVIRKVDFAFRHKEILVAMFLFAAVPPSMWALFVTAMWWG